MTTDGISRAEQRRLASELGWLPDDQLQAAYAAFRDWVRLAETLALWRAGSVTLSWDPDRELIASPINGTRKEQAAQP